MLYFICYTLVVSWDSSERRKFVRVKYPCKLSIHSTPGHAISANIENISAGGIRVIISEKLETASVINIAIYELQKEPLICKGKIRWVFTRKNPGIEEIYLFDTGIEFCKITKKDLNVIKKIIVSHHL